MTDVDGDADSLVAVAADVADVLASADRLDQDIDAEVQAEIERLSDLERRVMPLSLVTSLKDMDERASVARWRQQVRLERESRVLPQRSADLLRRRQKGRCTYAARSR